MNNRKLLISALLMAAGVSLFPVPSMAQPAGCTGMGPMGEQGQAMRGERMKQRQQQLHEALKLNPEQEKAWVKYQESHPFLGATERPDRAAMAKLTAPERADKMLEQSRKHQEAMNQHVTAMKAFYDVLTPEQKKTFDAQHAQRGPSGQRPMGKPQGAGGPAGQAGPGPR